MKAKIKTNKTIKIMAKIKELLAGREKLAKYDELTEWKEKFESFGKSSVKMTETYLHCDDAGITFGDVVVTELPSHIKEIIVNALDAEIKKLDEE